MPQNISAGILLYKIENNNLKIFLVHPGGPFFANKDEGTWSIPKGLPEENEELLNAAKRELEEETGIKPGNGFVPLGEIIQKGGKTVYAWASEYKGESNFELKCNDFEIEWPPNSGKKQSFPEVDKGEFFDPGTAMKKINQAQKEFIVRLENHLKGNLK